MALHLRIKLTSGRTIEQEADAELTIFELKVILSELVEAAPEQQTILHNGRVCQDENNLDSLGIKDGSTLILIRKSTRQSSEQKEEKKESVNQTQPVSGQTQPPTQASNQGNLGMNGGNMNLMNNMMSGMNLQSMQQQMLQNPELMKSLMESPIMRQMLGNPDLLQNMFNNNPALKQLLDDNPQLRHVLKDPQLMEHALRAASNPEYYNEMLRNNDRALQNIESLPGGFSALSRMYNQIQKPMERAMDDMYRQRFGTNRTVIREVDKSNGPTAAPMPNPYSADFKRKKQQEKMQKKLAQQRKRMGKQSRNNAGMNPFANFGMGGGMGGMGNNNLGWLQQAMGGMGRQSQGFGNNMGMNTNMYNPFGQNPFQSYAPQNQFQFPSYQSPTLQSVANANTTNASAANTGASGNQVTEVSAQGPPEELYGDEIRQLQEMGFEKELVLEAIVQAKGNLADAIDYIDSKMEENEPPNDRDSDKQ